LGRQLFTDHLRGGGQFAKRRNNLLRAVRLWQKATAFRQVVFPNVDKPRGRDDFDRRPLVLILISLASFRPSIGPGILDVGKDDSDVQAGFEDRNRLIGIGGFDTLKPDRCLISVDVVEF
jgi:hypothetical protein